MRALITGATGFVGGRVARRLHQRGHEVTAFVRTPSGELETLGIHQVTGDLADVDPRLLTDIDVVVHAAAAVGPDLASAREVNRDGTARLLQAALTSKTPRFVHISTTSVYDRQRLGDELVSEDAPLATPASAPGPVSSAGNAYAASKAEGDAEVARATQEGLSTAVLRPPAVLGAGPTSTWGTRVPRRILIGDPPPIHPDNTFAWVHVEDLVDAVIAAADLRTPVVANVVGGHTTFAAYTDAVMAGIPGGSDVPQGADAASTDDPAPPWRGRYDQHRATASLGVPLERGFEDAMREISASWQHGDPGGTR